MPPINFHKDLNYSYKKKLEENTAYFRNGIKSIGLDIKGKDHPIVPIMIYDAKKAVEMSEKLLEKEIYVIAFSFPVVPKDEARIRVQISASHSKKQIDNAINAFGEVAKELKII